MMLNNHPKVCESLIEKHETDNFVKEKNRRSGFFHRWHSGLIFRN